MNTQRIQPAAAADEVQIRERIGSFVSAFQATDLDGVLALYDPDIVSFDLVPLT